MLKIIRNLITCYISNNFIKTFIIILISLAIVFLSLSDFNRKNELSISIPMADKMVHFLMYFFYSTALFLAYTKKKYSQKNFIILSYCIAFGILIELLQLFYFLHRSGSFADIASNSAGAVFGKLFADRLRLIIM